MQFKKFAKLILSDARICNKARLANDLFMRKSLNVLDRKYIIT